MVAACYGNLPEVLMQEISQNLNPREQHVLAQISREHYLGWKGPEKLKERRVEFAVMRAALEGLAVFTWREGQVRLARICAREIHFKNLFTTQGHVLATGADYILPFAAGVSVAIASERMLPNAGFLTHALFSSALVVTSLARIKHVQPHNSDNLSILTLIYTAAMGLQMGNPSFNNMSNLAPTDILSLGFSLMPFLSGIFYKRINYVAMSIFATTWVFFPSIVCMHGTLAGIVAITIPCSMIMNGVYRGSTGACTTASVCIPFLVKFGKIQIKKHKLSTAIDAAATSAVLIAAGTSSAPAFALGMVAAGLAKCTGIGVVDLTFRKLKTVVTIPRKLFNLADRITQALHERVLYTIQELVSG